MTACPSDDDLAGHLAGELDAAHAVAVAAHVDACEICRAVVVGAVRGGVVSWIQVVDASRAGRTGQRAGLGTGAEAAPATAADRGRLMPHRRDATLTPGTEIGRYRIVELIGAGGMGVVYAAHDAALDREVALKVLRHDLAGDPAMLAERLVRESRLMAKASHPAVITVHDVGRDGDQVYVAMELIAGETLGAWLRRAPRTVDEVVALFCRAGAGLVAAHRAGLVHRDFKPDNVLVELEPPGERQRVGRGGDPAGVAGGTDVVARVLVTDFGVARAIAAAEVTAELRAVGSTDGRAAVSPVHVQLTATGATVGTPAYMAPEQLSGADVDERADVFGFAVSLWEAIYGVRPFGGATPNEIRAAMDHPPVAPRQRGTAAAKGRIPGWLVRALRAALVADPLQRTATVAALLAQLDPEPRRRRRRRVAAAVGAVAVPGAVVATIAAWPAPAAAPDPCALGRASLDARWSPARRAIARAGLVAAGTDAGLVDSTLTALDGVATAWRDTHAQTCKDQPPPITACLTARLVEIGATADELTLATPAAVEYPGEQVTLISSPAACLRDAPALAEPNVPVDPALQRAVAEARRLIFEIEYTRDGGDFHGALAKIPAATAAATATGWERVIAELMYVHGATDNVGGDTTAGITRLREAAKLAQHARYDAIAARVWIVLAHTTALDLHQTERGIEYLDYAQPAIDRLGKPADLASQLLYTRGMVEGDAAQLDDAEAHLRQALAIADPGAPEMVPMVVSGLGYVLEGRGRYAEAAEQYRRALELAIATDGPDATGQSVYRGRLAANLARSGQIDEAIVEARKALAIAEATLDEKQIDRMQAHVGLSEVLRFANQLDEALAQLDRALPMAAAIVGERSQTYGEVLLGKGELLEAAKRPKEALPVLERACRVLELTPDTELTAAMCQVDVAIALNDLRRPAAALTRIDAALPVIERIDGPDHGQLASAQIIKGDALLLLHRDAEAAAMYEVARATFAAGQLEDGFEAAAEYGLAQALYATEPARALGYAAAAVARWGTAAPMWHADRDEAAAWIAARKRGK
jgi:serine/threonine protein kinase/tetratricopeptide (TPR) repeat protein